MSTSGILVCVIVVAVVLYAIFCHNRLIRLKHNVKAAWSNVELLLRQRHDELPKLVTACREYLKFEQEALEKVIAARSQVASAMESDDVAGLGVAENVMHNALGRLFALTENYPELKANESFMRLQSRVSSLEIAIADRREFYNDSVNINNITVDAFPTNLVASWFSFKRADLFELADAQLADVDLEELFA